MSNKRNMNLKKPIWVCILVEIAVLVILGFMTVKAIRNPTEVMAPLNEWRSDYITFRDGWYVDEEMVQSSDTINVLYGPYVKLSKGSYSINIQYESEYDQSFQPYANSGNSAYIRAGIARLSKDKKSVTYKIVLEEDIDNFEIIVKYNGQGSLEIKDINITTNSASSSRRFFGFFIICVLIDLSIVFKESIEKRKNLFLGVFGILILSSIPLLFKGIMNGHDLLFHFRRIEAIADELRMGHFPVKMSSFYLEGYGYPVSVYYGDLLLYIPALLRLAGFSVLESYKAYIFLINCFTGLISYCCFLKIFKKQNIAFLTCFAYMTASYRMVNIFVREAVGEYSAMLFLPLIALAVYQIYMEDNSNWKSYKKNALLLALGMSGLIGTHILTVEMAIWTMLLICIVLWKKSIQKNTLKLYVLAVIQTIVLNLYFIVPFLDYYKNVDVNINHTVSDQILKIQSSGAEIGSYMAFFKNIFGLGTVNTNERMALTPGAVLMVTLIISVVLWLNKKADKEIKLFAGFSIWFLFMASDLFPWDFLSANFKLGNYLAQIQFPWRYIGIAVIFLTLLLGMVLKQVSIDYQSYQKVASMGVIALSIMMSVFFVSSYSDGMNGANKIYVCNHYETQEMDTKTDSLYLRAGTDTNLLNGEIVYENMQSVTLAYREGAKMEIQCVGFTDRGGDGIIKVPILNYKGYQVIDEYGKKYEITDGTNNVISFSVSPGFSGNITIDFVEPWYWRMAEAISFAAVVILCIGVLFKSWAMQKIVKKKQVG